MEDKWNGLRLDTSRPRGTICGPPPVGNAKYEQDGYFFNAAGDCVGVSQSPKKGRTVSGKIPTVGPGIDELIVTMSEKFSSKEIQGTIKKLYSIDMSIEDIEAITGKQEEADGSQDASEMILAMDGNGFNANEISDHLKLNGIDMSYQKVAAVLRKSKAKKAKEENDNP